jgi:hypothetical protein
MPHGFLVLVVALIPIVLLDRLIVVIVRILEDLGAELLALLPLALVTDECAEDATGIDQLPLGET